MNTDFLKRMKEYIPDEYASFLDTLNRPMYKGLRLNPGKMHKDLFLSKFNYVDEPSIFCKDAFYIHSNLGNHPYHTCGIYYLQEPSASSAVEILDVEESDIVLDLCAAPGGKSSQISSRIQSGFLVSNEIDAKRAQILLSNMERMGAKNFAVTNTTPQKIGSAFPCCFDKVLVDAPCSGEGMMKKHDEAKDNWSLDNIKLCATRQKEI
ncbi:MAG: hypothetical protein HUJ53_09105, partial [Holdemanella sp.]|nr:hypothetical protein [Holdemanella sp.]